MATLLKHLMTALPDSSKTAILTEISDLFKAKAGGVDYGLTMEDIMKEVKPADEKTLEQMQDEKNLARLKEGLSKFAADDYKAKIKAGVNIQEI